MRRYTYRYLTLVRQWTEGDEKSKYKKNKDHDPSLRSVYAKVTVNRARKPGQRAWCEGGGSQANALVDVVGLLCEFYVSRRHRGA